MRGTMSGQMKRKYNWMEFLCVVFLGTIAFWGVLHWTGALYSGWHFVDDHELIRMSVAFQHYGQSVLGQIKAWMVNDLHWRYRPMYWVERVICARLWGSDLLFWNYYTALKGVVTFVCLYYTARFLKYDRWISILFPCVILLGEQYTPWYRSANQESTGILFLSGTLCLIAAQAYYRKYKSVVYNALIVAGSILCGLTKESFTLFMPAFILLKLWLEYWDVDEDGGKGRRFLTCLRQMAVPAALILLSMSFNIYMLLFRVGVDKVSYAGFQKGVSLGEYYRGIKISLNYNMRTYTVAGALILLLAIVCYKNLEKKSVKKYLEWLLIGVFVMAVQLVAHAKSLMWQRYIIPYIVGYALVFLLLAYRCFEKDMVQRVVFCGIFLVVLAKSVPSVWQGAEDYARAGRLTEEVIQCTLERTAGDDIVIAAFADEELNVAVESRMEAEGRTKAYSRAGNEWKNEVQLFETVPDEPSWEHARAVLCYPWQLEELLEEMGQPRYEFYDFEDYGVIIISAF